MTETATPGQSASGKSQGSPTTSRAARSSSKDATVRGPNCVATTNSAAASGRWTSQAIPRPSAPLPVPSTQNAPNASPPGENNWKLSDENSKTAASVVTLMGGPPGSPIPYDPGSSVRKSTSGGLARAI